MSYGIDSYHIGVGAGDAAIHLLISNPDTSTANIIRAILVDGGDDTVLPWYHRGQYGKHILQNLKDTIQSICMKYSQLSLQFDAIVVTHWDSDHYGGINALIYADLGAQLAVDPPPDPKDIRCRLMKYEADTGDPQTVLYAPYWTPPPTIRRKPYSSPASNWSEQPYKMKAPPNDTIQALTYKYRVPGGVDYNFAAMCELRYDVAILGTNFLENRSLPSGVSLDAITSPKKLYENNPPSNSGSNCPGIYCVGVNQKPFVNNNASDAAVIEESPNGMGNGNKEKLTVPRIPGDVGIVDLDETTPTNLVSIFAMVIWKDGHISHYFAGDADYLMERQVRIWTGASGDFTVPGKSITTIKLSHHGSRWSSPTDVLTLYLPMNIIISNGPSYGHPVWEIVVFIDTLFRYLPNALARNPKPIYATTYPAWLVKDQATGKYRQNRFVSTNVFTEADAWGVLKNTMQACYNSINSAPGASGATTEDIFTWYSNLPSKRGDVVKKKLVENILLAMWSRISVTEPHHLAVTAKQAWVLPTMGSVSPEIYIRYFKVKCRPFQDPQEGKVLIQLFGDDEEILPPPPVVTPAQHSQQADDTYSAEVGSGLPQGDDTEMDIEEGVVVDGANYTEGDPSSINELEDPGMEVDSSDSESVELEDIDTESRRGVPVIRTPQVRASTSDIYRIYGSKFNNPNLDPEPGPDVVVLQDSSDLNIFINSLHRKVIGLTAKPSAASPTPFYDQDELYCWFKDSINATDLTCTAAASDSESDAASNSESDAASNSESDAASNSGSGAASDSESENADPTINGFNFTMASPLDTATNDSKSASSTNPPLKFSTEFADSSLGLSSPQTGTPDPGTTPISGFLSKNRIMAFGLDPSSFGLQTPPQTLNMTLLQVFNYVGLTRMTASTPLMLFLGTINLQLDPSLNGGKDSRNAVWFQPYQAYRTTLRLQFTLASGELDGLNSILQNVLTDFSLDKDSVTVITKRTSIWKLSIEGPMVQTEGEVILIATWTYSQVAFEVAIDFQESFVKIEVKTTQGNALGAILSWLQVISKSSTTFSDVIGWLQKADSKAAPNLRRVMLTINLGPDGKGADGKGAKLSSFSLDVEVPLQYGTGKSSTTNVFLVTLSWKGEGDGIANGLQLKGILWCANPLPSDAQLFFPSYEKYLEFGPTTPPPLSPTLDLVSLFGGDRTISNKPSVFPDELIQAYITLTSSSISFGGMLICQDPSTIPSNEGRPTLNLGSINLAAAYNWEDGSMALSCNVGVILQPGKDTSPQWKTPASLRGSISYNREPEGSQSSWTLYAGLQDLYLSSLYSFFDADAHAGGVMSFLEHLQIKYMDLTYNYSTDGKDTFDFNGNILIGPLSLTVTYSYKADSSWTFHAELDPEFAEEEESTVGEMVGGILGSSAVAALPSFVADIPIHSKDSLSFTCQKPLATKQGAGRSTGGNDDTNTASGFTYAGSLVIDKFQLSFTQYRSSTAKPSDPSKRLIKATLTGLPTSFNFPVVGDLTKPFDEAYYLWVDDKSKVGGLLQAEVDAINTQLETVHDKILVKQLSKKKPSPANVPVIVAGSHFVLVIKEDGGEETVVIDYAFGQPKGTSGALAMLKADSNTGGGGSGSSKAAFKKTIGPLTISNVGFQLQGNTLSILFDATFALGPLSFTLLGFGLGLEFKKGTNLMQLPDISANLKGLDVAFDRPPIDIAGLFEHQQLESGDLYLGGVIIGFTPYLFEAAGFYGKLALDPSQPKDKKITACIFGLLAGPLVELEFAEISGITGGFGYNSAVRYPSITEILSFPFISMKTAPPDPMQALLNMISSPGAWFTPADNSFWVAAGLKVTAFEALVIDAVVVVEWNPSVQLAIFGVAAADLPADPSIKEKFARVELGIAATVDFGKGIMKFEAQLLPTSFVLSPQCHLTGGFALYYWFEGSDPSMQGDWVFTIGGFNQAFDRPSQYPNPPRLGITWNLDDSLSITGQAYFAITPKMCMGGGLLRAAMSCGPLSAFFDAYADFLINYKPFHFMADAGVTVGVRFTMDLWFVTIHISIEIGAQLYLRGPPVFGTVHVDFWVFGFDINFGTRAEKPGPVSLEDFYKLVYQAGIQGIADSTSLARALAEGNSVPTTSTNDATPASSDHIFSCVSGRIPANNGSKTPSDDEPWLVRAATLSFQIACRVPIDSAIVKASEDDSGESVPPASNDIFAKPMHLSTTPLTSDMIITITSNPDPPDKPVWRILPVMKLLPAALWGKYDPNQDPSNSSATDIASLLSNSTDTAINLMAGVTITTPIAEAPTEKIIPFDAVRESMDEIQPGQYNFPPIVEQNNDWLPLPSTGTPDQWDKVESAWEKNAENAEKMVDDWADVFGWGNANLKGTPPPELLKGFGIYYVDAPLLSKEEISAS